MVTTMTHERFYRTGTYSVPGMGVYAGWTALSGSFADGQAFVNETKDVTLIFAGECYLDGETERVLKQKGRALKPSQGSWLIHLYEELGADFFGKLNGLFSGLLIDRRRHKACLFNDRYGIQRIYYHEAGGDVFFASEAKALLRILPDLREFDVEGVAEFLTFGCALADRTLFKGIQKLPGGSRWTFDHGHCRRETYFSRKTWEALPELLAEEYETRFQSVFKRILTQYFGDGTGLGIALTGGLDTRMIMAARPSGGSNPVSYTFTGPEGRTLDDQIAARVAKAGGYQHQLLRLEPDFFTHFDAHADRTIYLTDGASGFSGAHEIYFNRQARALAPVRLTGNYGSEVLRGISMFKPMRLSASLLNDEWTGLTRAAAAKPADGWQNPVTSAAFREIPWLSFGNLKAGCSQVSFRTPYLDNELVALACQVPSAMIHSALPALHLIKACSPAMSAIPTDRGFIGDQNSLNQFCRRLYAEVTFKLEYYNNEGLPKAVSGFNPVYRAITSRMGLEGLHKFLRYASWYRGRLRNFLTGRMASPNILQGRFWNTDFIQAMTGDHLSGRNNYGAEINMVLTLEAIERVLFRDLPRG
jgi:asparagine synthase (glutamine-hydrolysing)